MQKISIWINAMRPRTLPLSISGVIVGSAIAYRYNLFSLKIFVPAMLTTIFLQILSNLANDFGDAQKGADGADRIGPQRMVQSGLLSKKEILTGMGLFATASFVSGIYLLVESFGSSNAVYFLLFLALGILAIWAAIKYTVGRTAYGYRGLGDLFVLVFFGFVSVSGSAFLFMGHFHTMALLQSAVIGFLATGVLHLNNMRDRVSDQSIGKETLAVKMGFQNSKIYFYLLIFPAMGIALISSLLYGLHLTDYIFTLSFIPLLWLVKKVYQNSEEKKYNDLLKPLALSTFLYSILLFIGFIL